jgi:prepilin peptidase CpaA
VELWDGISDFVLAMALLISLITDLRERKIYNKVVFPATGAAFLLSLVDRGAAGLGLSLAGWLTGIGLLIIPYLLGGMGAGDVKLLGLVGAAKGTVFVLYAGLYMFLAGGILALGVLIFRQGFALRLKRILCGLYAWSYGQPIPLLTRDSWTGTYPYGVAIAAGAALCYGLRGWGIG